MEGNRSKSGEMAGCSDDGKNSNGVMNTNDDDNNSSKILNHGQFGNF